MDIKGKALVAAVLASMAASPVLAGESAMPSRSVSYAGLDLTQPHAAAEVERRIARAVRQVCRQAYGGSIVLTEAQCRAETRKTALAAFDRAVALAEARKATQLASR
jgi:UrcA family protein